MLLLVTSQFQLPYRTLLVFGLLATLHEAYCGLLSTSVAWGGHTELPVDLIFDFDYVRS